MDNKIAQIRKYFKKNQSEFAKDLEISQSLLSQIESEKKELSDRIRYIICSKFGISEKWLISGSGEMLSTDTTKEEETDFFEVYRGLTDISRKDWLDHGRKMMMLENALLKKGASL
ncbi:hypothetical protein FACS1894172_09450 [Spirochaetia bacterium]|nr:hypothetical protein FACS1894172_09450 [Spirochaetia bacterium]